MATELRVVNGYVTEDKNGCATKIVACKVTSDSRGEWISLGAAGITIGVPFKIIENMIKKARRR